MLWISNRVVVSSERVCTEEQTGATHGPISHEQHHEWSIRKHSQCLLLQLVVIHWWLPEVIEECPLFNQIHIHNTKCGNREEHWEEESVHEADEDLGHDGTILEMHKVDWSGVHINILHGSGCFSL